MDLNLMVIDDFLENPDKVREFALNCHFTSRGQFPGVRASYENKEYNEEIDYKLNELIGAPIEHKGASRQFQICTEYEDDNWIHHDTKDLAGVLYLTPDAPLEYGTSIFRHKNGLKYGYHHKDENNRNEDEWEETIKIGNVYNRLILYNGYLYHRSNNFGFGKSLEYSRLTQVFFMDMIKNEDISNRS